MRNHYVSRRRQRGCCTMRLVFVVLVSLSFTISVTSQELADALPCDSKIYCDGPLLEAAQNAYVFNDSKTFVDLHLKYPPDEVLAAFEELDDPTDPDVMRMFVDTYFDGPNLEFEEWIPTDWDENPEFLNRIDDLKLRDWANELHALWKELGRKINIDVSNNQDRYSLIYVDQPFVVPGGRFREFYYWDSYWVIKGLIISGMTDTVKGMLSNFADMVDKLGFVPNGNRVYYTNRSQPPYFIPSVYEYYKATGDYDYVKSLLPILEKEYAFWMSNRTVSVEKPGAGESHLLNRYDVFMGKPRPESFREDAVTCSSTNKDKIEEHHRQRRGPTDVDHTISCDSSLNLQIVVQHADPLSGIEQVQFAVNSAANWASDHTMVTCNAQICSISADMRTVTFTKTASATNIKYAYNIIGLVVMPPDWIPDPYTYTCGGSGPVGPTNPPTNPSVSNPPTNSPDESARICSDLASGAESGWDYTSRWLEENHSNLKSIRTKQVVPVELNSILCMNEKILSDFFAEDGQQGKADEYMQAHVRRRRAIQEIFWAEDTGAWLDYDLELNQNRDHFYPSNVLPLWANCYADGNGDSDIEEKVFNYMKDLGVLDYPGGIPTSLQNTAEQWDYPNAWPPLQEMVIQALGSSSVDEANEYAFNLAQTWTTTNWKSYIETDVMFEKYDVEKQGVPGHGGEYEVQAGFGWTNGVMLTLLDKYGDKLTSAASRIQFSHIHTIVVYMVIIYKLLV